MTLQANIDKIFKEGLAEYSQKPPTFVWDNIDRRLQKKRIKQRRNIFYSLAASIALLISFGAGYLLTGFHNEQGVIVQNASGQFLDGDEQDAGQSADMKAKESKTTFSESNDAQQVSNKKESKIKSQPVIGNKPGKTNQSKTTKSTESKVKKVSAGGTLLPPMFSSEATYASTPAVYQEPEQNNQEALLADDLAFIPVKSAFITNKTIEHDIIYTLRELPMYPDKAEYSTEKVASVWSVGLDASPLVSYRSVGAVNSDYAYTADITSNYEADYSNEKPLVAYATGVNVAYNFSSRWQIQSGVYFSEIGQISENVNVFDYQSFDSRSEDSYNVNTSAGNIRIAGSTSELSKSHLDGAAIVNEPTYAGEEIALVSSNSIFADFIQTFSYYEIPMVVNYKLIDKKLSMNLSGGMSANIMYANKAYVKEGTDRTELDGETEDIKNLSYNGIIGFGFEYPLISKLNFNLQPTFRYSLNPLNESGNVHPYSFGVFTGIKYSF
jgi:hypothetical protein